MNSLTKGMIGALLIALLAACLSGIVTKCSSDKKVVYAGASPAILAQLETKKDRHNDSVAYLRYYRERLAKDSIAARKDAEIGIWKNRYYSVKNKGDQKVAKYQAEPTLANCDSALTARGQQVDKLEEGVDLLLSRLNEADKTQCLTDDELKRNRLVIGLQNDNLRRANEYSRKLEQKSNPVFTLGLGLTPGFDIITGRPVISIGPNLNFNFWAFKRRKVVDGVQ